MSSLMDRETLNRIKERAGRQAISPEAQAAKRELARGMRVIRSFSDENVGSAVLLSGLSVEEARRLGAC